MQGEESAVAAAADFFTKKKTRLQRAQLEALLRRAPALLPPLLPELLRQAAGARNEHLQLETLHLLATALKVGAAACLAEAVCSLPRHARSSIHTLLLRPCHLQAGGGGTPAALSGGDPALVAAVLAAVSGQFSKPQRQVEAAKAACLVVEGAGGATGGKAWQQVQQAAQCVADGADPKLAAALQRLEELLEAPAPSEAGGKRGKADGAAKAPAAKKQKQQV